MLQPKAGYIDARPLTAISTKSSCYARPDHTMGHQRRFGDVRIMSACPSTPDILMRRGEWKKRAITGLAIKCWCVSICGGAV